MCHKESSRWLCFQAVAQNSELRERLRKIHAESHVVEPALINLTAPAKVGAGMHRLPPPRPPHHHPVISTVSYFLILVPSISSQGKKLKSFSSSCSFNLTTYLISFLDKYAFLNYSVLVCVDFFEGLHVQRLQWPKALSPSQSFLCAHCVMFSQSLF